MLIIKILLLVAAWVFFYQILKARQKKLPGLKASIITLLFASLIFRWAIHLYDYLDGPHGAVDKQRETPIATPPLQNSTVN